MIAMKKRSVLLKFIPMLLIMAAIFYFSQQRGEESSELSDGVVAALTQSRLFSLWSKLFGDNTDLATKIVRKTAHFSEYALLGWFTVYAFKSVIRSKWSACIFSEALVFLYAVSDEFHQTFVPGRSASPIDVGIDSMGALFGIWLFMIFAIIADRIKRKKRKRLQNKKGSK